MYSERPEQRSDVSRPSARLRQLKRAWLQRERRLQLLARERAQLGPRGRRKHVDERDQVRVRAPAQGQRGRLGQVALRAISLAAPGSPLPTQRRASHWEYPGAACRWLGSRLAHTRNCT